MGQAARIAGITRHLLHIIFSSAFTLTRMGFESNSRMYTSIYVCTLNVTLVEMLTFHDVTPLDINNMIKVV